MKTSGIGGQAVIEGIMMKNKDRYAVAVRKPDQEIDVMVSEHKSIIKNGKIQKMPVVRGVVNFIDSMVLGMKTLTYSGSFYEEEEQPTKADRLFEKVFKDKAEKVVMGITVAVSIAIAVGIFMILPFFLSDFLRRFIVSDTLIALAEGVIRIALFLGYIVAISFLKDIQRVFMYHGSEHKCINCIEHGLELTVENVRASSKEHKRCGTSFLLIVMVISVIFFMLIRVDSTVLRLVLRLVLVPVIAGIAYEFIKLAGNTENRLVDILSRPGMWLQGLTTKEPDDSMIEVAIAAVEAVFDWRAYQAENAAGASAAPDAGAGSAVDEAAAQNAVAADVKTTV